MSSTTKTRKISNLADIVWTMALGMVIFLRLSLCFRSPVETTDTYRNLGYSFQLSNLGFAIYNSVANQFSPQYWSHFWPNVGYIYPPAALCFFAPFSYFGLGLVWVKLSLTATDFLSAWLIGRETTRMAGILTLLAPVAIWFTSLEGQFESLVLLCLVLSLVSANRNRWLACGIFFALGFQFKLFSVLLFPLLFYHWLIRPRTDRTRAAIFFTLGSLLAILPFFGFYYESPDIFLRPFINQSHLIYNPFHFALFANGAVNHAQFTWEPTTLIFWDSLSTYLLLGALIAFVATGQATGRQRITRFALALPAIGFLILIKSLNWGQFWYMILFPGFVLAIGRESRRWLIALLAIYCLHEARSLSELYGYRYGIQNNQNIIGRFNECLWTCDYSAP